MRKFKFFKIFWEYILHTFSTWKKINWPLLNNMHAFTYIYYQNSLSGLLLWNHCTELLCRYMWSFRNKINSFSVQLLWKLFLQTLTNQGWSVLMISKNLKKVTLCCVYSSMNMCLFVCQSLANLDKIWYVVHVYL